jgi:hypothetical protein
VLRRERKHLFRFARGAYRQTHWDTSAHGPMRDRIRYTRPTQRKCQPSSCAEQRRRKEQRPDEPTRFLSRRVKGSRRGRSFVVCPERCADRLNCEHAQPPTRFLPHKSSASESASVSRPPRPLRFQRSNGGHAESVQDQLGDDDETQSAYEPHRCQWHCHPRVSEARHPSSAIMLMAVVGTTRTRCRNIPDVEIQDMVIRDQHVDLTTIARLTIPAGILPRTSPRANRQ